MKNTQNQNKMKIEIDKEITESNLVEQCLNLKHSGYDYRLLFYFYTLGKRWHITKLNYYMRLIEKNNQRKEDKDVLLGTLWRHEAGKEEEKN